MKRFLTLSSALTGACLRALPVWAAKPIQHDAEHYVLLHQYQKPCNITPSGINKFISWLIENYTLFRTDYT